MPKHIWVSDYASFETLLYIILKVDWDPCEKGN